VKSEGRREPAELLLQGAAELHLDLPEAHCTSLVAYVDLLSSWAPRLNLSGFRDPKELARRLILDCLAVHKLLPDPAERIADLGSGAGIPGIPLAILRPRTQVILVESRERRHYFQRAAIRQLALEGRVSAVHGRIEELAPQPSDLVVAQAVAQVDRVLEMATGWVAPGGTLVIPTGLGAPPETPATGALRLVRAERYRVPLGGPERALWFFERPR
jgi:16S rRNA (guanine527-N7)-methyltransferase